MSNRIVISTTKAPMAIGPYSQGVRIGDLIWVSGQIPLIPGTQEFAGKDIRAQTIQVFDNLSAIAESAGCTLNNAIKINISLTDLGDFDVVNKIMAEFLQEPYPARACVQVAALPKGAAIEIEAILSVN